MDEERLIIEVENHRIIYDTTHPFYKDNTKKYIYIKYIYTLPTSQHLERSRVIL